MRPARSRWRVCHPRGSPRHVHTRRQGKAALGARSDKCPRLADRADDSCEHCNELIDLVRREIKCHVKLIDVELRDSALPICKKSATPELSGAVVPCMRIQSKACAVGEIIYRIQVEVRSKWVALAALSMRAPSDASTQILTATHCPLQQRARSFCCQTSPQLAPNRRIPGFHRRSARSSAPPTCQARASPHSSAKVTADGPMSYRKIARRRYQSVTTAAPPFCRCDETPIHLVAHARQSCHGRL